MYLGARLEPTVARGLSRVVHLEGENTFASSRVSLTLLKEIHTPLQRCTRACVDTCLLKHGRKCTCGEAHAASSVTVSCVRRKPRLAGRLPPAWPSCRASRSPERFSGSSQSRPPTRRPCGHRCAPWPRMAQGQTQTLVLRAAHGRSFRFLPSDSSVSPRNPFCLSHHLLKNIRVFPAWGNNEELPESVPSGQEGVRDPQSLQEVERADGRG